jgi:hypothetical protein
MLKKQFKSTTLEAKSPYQASVYRNDILPIAKTIYLLQESINGESGPVYEGGLMLATNSLLLRFKFGWSLDETIVLLKSQSKEGPFYQRIFLEPRRGFTLRISWYAFRTTFGILGDIPLQIVGIKTAEADEIGLLNSAILASEKAHE